MALGFGGTSVAGYAILNYTLERPLGLKGLLGLETMAELALSMGLFYESLFGYLKRNIEDILKKFLNPLIGQQLVLTEIAHQRFNSCAVLDRLTYFLWK